MADSDNNSSVDLEFSSVDVSEEGESDGENRLGVIPYQFEPVDDNPENDMTVEVEELSEENAVNRLDNTSW